MHMAETLLVGAAVGAVFGELLTAVMEMKGKAILFKETLTYLEMALTIIAPVIKEIEQHNDESGRSKEELESLIKEMEEGTKLVYRCSRIHRLNLYARLGCQEQLAALIESLMRFSKNDMQAQIARDLKESVSKARRVVTKPSLFRTGSSYSESATKQDEDFGQKEIHGSDENATETSSSSEEDIDHPRILLPSGSGSIPLYVRELQALRSKPTQPARDAVWTNPAEAEQVMEDINNPSLKIKQRSISEPGMPRSSRLSGVAATTTVPLVTQVKQGRCGGGSAFHKVFKKLLKPFLGRKYNNGANKQLGRPSADH